MGAIEKRVLLRRRRQRQLGQATTMATSTWQQEKQTATRRFVNHHTFEICGGKSINELYRKLTMISSTEWLGHQLGHLFGEVRNHRILARKIMNLQMLSQLAPTCSFLVAETSPSSSGTSPAMRPRTATPSAVSTATLTSSPTVYVNSRWTRIGRRIC